MPPTEPPTPTPRPRTTPLGEAVEQTTDGVSTCCRNVADLVQADVDRIATGDYHFADLATVGVRLLHVGLNNALVMAAVVADNMALLSADEPDDKGANQPQMREASVLVPVPSDKELTITTSSLRGRTTGERLPQSRITVSPQTCPAGTASPVPVAVKVDHQGFRRDIYVGTLSVMEGDRPVSSVEYLVAVDRTL